MDVFHCLECKEDTIKFLESNLADWKKKVENCAKEQSCSMCKEAL